MGVFINVTILINVKTHTLLFDRIKYIIYYYVGVSVD